MTAVVGQVADLAVVGQVADLARGVISAVTGLKDWIKRNRLTRITWSVPVVGACLQAISWICVAKDRLQAGSYIHCGKPKLVWATGP